MQGGSILTICKLHPSMRPPMVRPGDDNELGAQDVGTLNLALATGRINAVQYMQAMGMLQESFQAAQREAENTATAHECPFNLIAMLHQSLDVYAKDLDEETLFVVSQTFKALSDPTRIRILNLLFLKEYSVNDIAENLHLRQSTVSHQLRFLKNLRLVKYRREGTTLYYSHDDSHVMNMLKETIDHACHH